MSDEEIDSLVDVLCSYDDPDKGIVYFDEVELVKGVQEVKFCDGVKLFGLRGIET